MENRIVDFSFLYIWHNMWCWLDKLEILFPVLVTSSSIKRKLRHNFLVGARSVFQLPFYLPPPQEGRVEPSKIHYGFLHMDNQIIPTGTFCSEKHSKSKFNKKQNKKQSKVKMLAGRLKRDERFLPCRV